ncbi:bifunctional glutamate N-acetyltransferase/amino-acid acetyltransferase ArgJ [Selenomonas dianae]|uniref:Arginine biosynthesis bifunctional protein ArgJ n=1 Tax=Selenomonas dianae TaxID=135079 RepID=A0ABN0SZB6_9FIRM|nr:bifunctional glutamate N-acetyltransferase/amino-acid acetyltransferase ArgJ [Selenomonas dianae]WLD83369.1 bifunctional glutamate N-acetyltransferase/amino-acid acetyltransferase ArgJ [Selenomonas dianae]
MFSEASARMGVTYPKGFQAAGVKAGIKKSGNLDVAVIYTEKKAAVAGTFTKNAVAAAPVHVSKAVVATHTAHAIVANAGCANACTGAQGEADAAAMQKIAADALGCTSADVIVGSTGIIGQLLPMDKVEQGIHAAVKALSVDGSADAGNAIITTDTYSKAGATSVMIGGKEVRFGIIAKGSGMIRPDMATVLCFITTDADIDGVLLQDALSEVIEHSLNMISIDGDMSTNDMAIVLANGAAGNPKITEKNADYEAFKETLLALCQGISEKIAADGEGATKFITVHVKGAKSFADAKTVGMSVANSPLVKTAFFGEDPNWGRVICAVGYAGVPMNPNHTTVKFGGIPVYADGMGVSYDADALRMVMTAHDIVVEIDLKDGTEEAKVWTCDFSYEYVKINGEYHT